MSNQGTEIFARAAHNPSFFEVSALAPKGRPVLDFCVPVNLHYPKEELFDFIYKNLDAITKYYPDYAEVHQAAVAKLISQPVDNIVVANGSTEIITELVRSADGPLLTCAPTFGQWTDLPPKSHVAIDNLLRRREHSFRLDPAEIIAHVRAIKAQTLVLSNPNNPTGVGMALEEIAFIAQSLSDLSAIIIDESFIDFSDLESASSLAVQSDNLIVVKSLGKTLGLHGVRIGYAVTNIRSAERLRSRLPYWNVNGLAAAILSYVADRPQQLHDSLKATAKDRDAMAAALKSIPNLEVFPSDANFLMVGLDKDISGTALRERLLTRHGIFIRECGNKIGSTSSYLRLAVASKPAIACLVEALQTELPE